MPVSSHVSVKHITPGKLGFDEVQFTYFTMTVKIPACRLAHTCSYCL